MTIEEPRVPKDEVMMSMEWETTNNDSTTTDNDLNR